MYDNADFSVSESNAVSKTLFPAHVRDLHRNREEGFENEFEVRVKTCRDGVG